MRTLNLGILAHIDAGKTSLTERLLFKGGVIDTIGRVDDGNTQTDTLALERQRGITIRTAVMSFAIDDLGINLIDTPGHPDFIAEVERVLSVLDGAVLVVSAVEGVQAQTRVLMRTLKRLRIPTVIFVNKIDRRGARHENLLADIRDRLTPDIVPLMRPVDPGTRAADAVQLDAAAMAAMALPVLAERDEALLAAFVEGGAVSPARLMAALAEQTRRGEVHPLFFGSAMTGVGIDHLTVGLADLLPGAAGDAKAPLEGTVFKIERGPAREKIAYVRLRAGRIAMRDRVQFGARSGKVTGLQVYDRGPAVQAQVLEAGQIGRLRGLEAVRVGDALGVGKGSGAHHFAPPTLETVVAPAPGTDAHDLHMALTLLAEQDPLIDLRQDAATGALSVSLYGEVQKEVIGQMLEFDFGVRAEFRDTTTICIERVTGTAAALEELYRDPNPFVATVGIRVEPGSAGSGVRIAHEDRFGTMPVSFHEAIELTIPEVLKEGLHGWAVTDCLVTVTHSAHHAPVTTAADLRGLTPLVLMDALKAAGTVVCEPIHRFRIEGPADGLAGVLSALVRLGALPEAPRLGETEFVVEGDIRAANVHALQIGIPGLTHGEGVIECVFDRFAPVTGVPPERAKAAHHPIDRKAYLRHVHGG